MIGLTAFVILHTGSTAITQTYVVGVVRCFMRHADRKAPEAGWSIIAQPRVAP